MSGGLGVRVSDLNWRHPGRATWALRNVNLDIAPGERVLISGPSGVGKSTLLRIMSGVVQFQDAAESSGEVAYTQHEQTISAQAAADQLGLLLQDPESNLLMTRVGDEVAFGLENACMPPAKIWPQVAESLREVGFRYDVSRLTSALSGGEKQRVALAAVLARHPGLLILDEPTANLDPAGAAGVVESLGSLITRNRPTLIMVEHRLDRVAGIVDRLVLLGPEGVVVDSPIDEVVAKHADALTGLGVFIPGTIRTPTKPTLPRVSSDAVLLDMRSVTVQRRPDAAPALDDVSVTFKKGAVVGVVGANGAGKSTLSRVLGGLLSPTSGGAWLTGRDKPVHKLTAPDLARRIGSVFQEPDHQFVTDSVRGELLAGGRAVDLGKEQSQVRADEILNYLGLAPLASVNPYTLSGGEKRRLAVGVALVGHPDVLILDEPTFAQDGNGWRAIVDLLQAQSEAGTTVVLVSHDEALIAALNADTITLEAGRIVDISPASSLTEGRS